MNRLQHDEVSELTSGEWVTRVFRTVALVAFLLLLAGYLVFNRSFAHLGSPPFYVGEMAIGLALFAALFDFKNAFIEPLKRSRAMQCVAVFMFYGLVRVAIDLPSRGLDAARDGVLCLYALTAFLAPWLLRTGKLLSMQSAAITLVSFLFPVSLGAFGYAYVIAHGWVAPFPDVKVDFLALSTAVAMCVLFGKSVLHMDFRMRDHYQIPTFIILLAFLVSLGTLVNTLPTRALWPAPGIMILVYLISENLFRKQFIPWLVILLFSIIGGVALNGYNRTMHEKMEALGDPDERHFQTREGQMAAHSVKWRLVFWKRCIGETVTTAPVFGLGFGTNLTDLLRDTPEWPMFADSQNAVKYGSPNRHPHSAHVSVFARLGTVGLLVWLALIGTVFARGLVNCRKQRERYRLGPRDRFEEERTAFMAETTVLSIWCVYLLAMSFGVVLENPFGGIWFWTLTGVIANRPQIAIPLSSARGSLVQTSLAAA